MRRSELNCFSWAQTYVKDNLKGLFVHENGQKGDVTSVSDVKGDVSMANRKGKVRTFFDLTLTLELAGACFDRVMIPANMPQ